MNLRTSAYDEAPAPLVPALIEGGESGYWLEESRPDGTRSAWLVSNWKRIRRGLYQSYVITRATSRTSPDDPPSTAPGVLLWTPAGRVVRLDADAFVATDKEGTVWVGTCGGSPCVWSLPPGIGETDNPVPVAVPTNLPQD